ncbi:NUDIX domain-containing protein [Streptomyces diastatochromogenes]|uniref:NUDIX domain-containing protein n=1 Tax=Streptomyces diastatochromogenes TaxID=42236 RepID=UPI003CC5C648
MLLVAHRKAGLWLPAGGHVEPGVNPWAAVVRECHEELGIEAVASPITGGIPSSSPWPEPGESTRTPTSRSGTCSMPTPAPSPRTTKANSMQSGG